MTTTYRGMLACDCMPAWLDEFQKAIGRQVQIFQLIGGATQSAGTHATGGAIDTETLTAAEQRIARNMGGASWDRTPAEGFSSYHTHTVLKGCPHAAASAQAQVVSCDDGRNGLANNGPDDGPRDGVQWPLRTYSDGINWAQQEADMQLTDTFEMTNADGSKRVVSVAEALSAAIYYGDVLHKQIAEQSPANGPSTLSDADKDDIAARNAAKTVAELSQKLGA